MTFPIVEIFSSIQGEGTNLGRPANFIRFAGCNLNCEWCDTEWRKASEHLDIATILRRLDPEARLVVLTGGEPTIQKNLIELVDALMEADFAVAMETNGTNSTRALYSRGVHISCSPKPATMWCIHDECEYDELKYVVDDLFSAAFMEAKLPALTSVWLQPEGGNMQEAWKKALRIQKEYHKMHPDADVRIGVQLHKIMEVR